MAGRERVAALVVRLLEPTAVTGLGPALTAAAGLDLDVIALTAAFADRPGLLLLTAGELRFVTADAADQATAFLDRVATVQTASYEGRPVLIVLGSDSRRTMFQIGDTTWTDVFAGWVNLALDDPGAAVMAVDRYLGPAALGSTPPPAAARRTARERLGELDDLRGEGLLTAEEYAKQRAAIIGQV